MLQLALLFLLLPSPTHAGFDWGASCSGGNGTFSQDLPTAGETSVIGQIPTGKWSLTIKLSSLKDVDVQVSLFSLSLLLP